MKNVAKILSICLMLFAIQNSNGQLLKKLKNKINNKVEQVEQKIENKIENKVDKKIDETVDNVLLENNSNSNEDEDEVRNADTKGNATINHSIKFGSLKVDELSQAKTISVDEEIRVIGSWVTMAADIYDGYVLIVPNGLDVLFDGDVPKQNITLSIPSQATLILRYDPSYDSNYEDENGKSTAVTKDYQDYELESGEVTISAFSKDNLQISYSGTAKLVTRTLNTNQEFEDKYILTYDDSSISGSINVNHIDFRHAKRKEEKQAKENLKAPEFNSSPDLVKGTYQFTHETKVKVTNIEENETYHMSYLLNPSVEYIGLKTDMSEYSDEEMAGESVVVMDGDNVHIFVETQGMKMQMSQNMMGGQQQNPTDQMADYDYSNITKTGNTKTILGATCYEYIMADKDVKMNIWVAPSISLPNWFIQNNEVIKGHIMEYTVTSKDGNMRSETIAINDNINQTINPTDYRKMF